MSKIVGIIANPASGKDIRRLVAHASVFDNNEKINIIQRVLLALEAVGVAQARFMPDYYGFDSKALDGLKLSSLQARSLDMPTTATDRDSTEAARLLCEMDAGAIIVLGGDGTNRVVAKGCGRVPIVPISTGTNNVFPSMVEGTVAGMAAGLVALGVVDAEQVTFQAKRLEVYMNRKLADVALVDVVTSSDLWVGARAIWDPSHIREIVLARAEPGAIGLSSLGSCLGLIDAREEHGMYLAIGTGGAEVLAPLGPGLVAHIPIREHRLLNVGDEVALDPGSGTIALDGEREIEVYGQPEIAVRLTKDGPRVVDIARCMREAASQGFFRS